MYSFMITSMFYSYKVKQMYMKYGARANRKVACVLTELLQKYKHIKRSLKTC